MEPEKQGQLALCGLRKAKTSAEPVDRGQRMGPVGKGGQYKQKRDAQKKNLKRKIAILRDFMADATRSLEKDGAEENAVRTPSYKQHREGKREI